MYVVLIIDGDLEETPALGVGSTPDDLSYRKVGHLLKIRLQ